MAIHKNSNDLHFREKKNISLYEILFLLFILFKKKIMNNVFYIISLVLCKKKKKTYHDM